MNVKMIPNVLTTVRLLGAVGLFFLAPMSLQYYIVYGICGITDAVDGFLARTFHAVSDFGSKLDSVADLVFYSSMLICNFPELWRVLPFWIWIFFGVVLLIRISAYVLTAVRYHQFASIHSIFNKLTGLLVFMIPFALLLPRFDAYGAVTVSVALVASVYELYYLLVKKQTKA